MHPSAFVHVFTAMTTRCELQFYGVPPADGVALAERIERRVAQLVQRWNFHASNSWLTRFVNQRRGDCVELDDEAAHILSTVREHSERTGSAFDITVGTLAMRLHGVRSVREAQAIRTQLSRYMGLSSWEIDKGPHGVHLRFAHPATRLDMGGVIKEFAVDESARLARDAGVPAGLVNYGGDLSCWGVKPDGARFIAAIPDPGDPQRMSFALDLQDQTLTTSGHYARQRMLPDGRLSHVRGTLPMQSSWQSVSVLAERALISGIYSTALLIDGGVELPPNTTAIVVDDAGRVGTLDAESFD